MPQDMLGVSVQNAQGAVADLLEKLGGRNGDDWLVALKRFLRKEDAWAYEKWQRAGFMVRMDYDISLDLAIERAGIDWAHQSITADLFPLVEGEVGQKMLWVDLLGFDETLRSHEVLERLESVGLRPATLRESLALITAQPNIFGIRSQFKIIVLRSQRGSNRYGDSVPIIFEDESGLNIGVGHTSDRFHSWSIFPAVKIKS